MKQCPKCNTQCNDTKIYCPNCGNLLEAVIEPMPPTVNKKSNAGKIVPIVLLISLIGNVILGIGLYNSSEDADWYSSRYRSMQFDYYEIKDSYDFYDEYARVVPGDGSGKYHRYGCSKLGTSSFWIYNLDLAKDKASPCPYCCSDD